MADVFEKFVTPRPEVNPTIYAYRLNGVTTHDGYIKVGYTDRDVKQRIKEQLHTSAISYTVLCEESAMRPDGSCFNDHDVHAVLKRNGFHRLNENTDKNEWYNCTVMYAPPCVSFAQAKGRTNTAPPTLKCVRNRVKR